MNINKVDIIYYSFVEEHDMFLDNITHIKSLPFLSIVQSTIGDYEIKMDDSPVYHTHNGGFFIAPSIVSQKITHHYDRQKNIMKARWLFLDARINDKYYLDELFSFPIIVNKASQIELNECFDLLTNANSTCKKMSIIYRIIDILINISIEKDIVETNGIIKAVKYIHNNYKKQITISTLAKIANMSESNFYASFKKQFSHSPIEYLNKTRLSIALNILELSDDSISNISSQVGINDPFYFSKLFKKAFLLSPREYKKALKINKNHILKF